MTTATTTLKAGDKVTFEGMDCRVLYTTAEGKLAHIRKILKNGQDDRRTTSFTVRTELLEIA